MPVQIKGVGSISGLDQGIVVGIATATNFKSGTSNVHSTGYECTNVNASGIITAAQFKGDGSNLTGLAGREVYGFTGIGKSLSLTTTNGGADNITNAEYVAFEQSFIGPSGLSFSIICSECKGISCWHMNCCTCTYVDTCGM